MMHAPFSFPYENPVGSDPFARRHVESASHKAADPTKRTQQPYVTGTSVLAMTYKDGVMLAADTLGSYGSLARYLDLRRLRALNNETVIAGTGDYSDFQEIVKILDELLTNDRIEDDGSILPPSAIHSYMTRVMYGRRNKNDPLWNQIITAGVRNGVPFLGLSDLQGGSYQDVVIATGYGGHLALPLMRKAHRPDMTYDEAKDLMESCMRVLFYRDARSFYRIQLATATAAGTNVTEPYELPTDWSVGKIFYDPSIKNTPILPEPLNVAQV
eukprot:TRINITY_DN9669_c0_g1_i1.p1 TRINITY_DN9669_c0_g1~~TRINITY_DN9669_c0_g1_i1.p1  ORF type:complete len:271 (-),score=67.24 TRINITY_DN9669_c0_g1_i1:152-964(-)